MRREGWLTSPANVGRAAAGLSECVAGRAAFADFVQRQARPSLGTMCQWKQDVRPVSTPLNHVSPFMSGDGISMMRRSVAEIHHSDEYRLPKVVSRG